MVWFLHQQALWRASLYGTSERLRLTAPKRLVEVSYQTGRWLRLTASKDGLFVVIDDGSGYDLDSAGGLWLVRTRPEVTRRKLLRTAAATFSPDRPQLAVTRIDPTGKYSVAVLDLALNRCRTLLPNATEPFWSADGREIALIQLNNDGDCGVVVEARSGKVCYRTGQGITRAKPLLSPDGRFFADLCAISRPKLGHKIRDRRNGKEVVRSLDWRDRLPTELYGWSPDGNWLACNWRVPDPNNDGTWLQGEVGLVSWKPGIYRWIDAGNKATFGPDSQHLFWLRPTGTLCATTVGSQSAPIQKLLTQVEAFAVG